MSPVKVNLVKITFNWSMVNLHTDSVLVSVEQKGARAK